VSWSYGGDLSGVTKSIPENTRCVAGSLPTITFDDRGDGTVLESGTGLVWTKCWLATVAPSPVLDHTETCSTPPGEGSWHAALAACENLEFAGHSDWRLPSARELLTLSDYTSVPTLDTSVFPGTPAHGAWASTVSPYSSDSALAWELASDGLLRANAGTDLGYSARCVRGPE
jgi:hypothetical protein